MNKIIDIICANKQGVKSGIYAVCCAQPLVIEAAMLQAIKDQSPLLIEATANQVNQFGGYTGMKPTDFIQFINNIAEKLNFPREDIILGGDHLGPVCWIDEQAEQALEKSRELIASYVAAGFKKIHLDTSMPCHDDPRLLPDETVAHRAASLCLVAEQTAIQCFGHSDIVYVIGTEVPPPGGAAEAIHTLEPTPVNRVAQTLSLHQQAFEQLGLTHAWSRVIGLVVQPGVEFDHTDVFDYQPSNAESLKHYIKTIPALAYEAHSTDYQQASAYKALIADHFAILKVGPQLTYAMREALYGLSYIEQMLVPTEQGSFLRDVCEQEMLESPAHWQKFYQVPASQGSLYRRFSYSDRIRYYWNNDRVDAAVAKLINNLSSVTIPLPLLSQFLPEQYHAVRQGEISTSPVALIHHKIMQVTGVYAAACFNPSH